MKQLKRMLACVIAAAVAIPTVAASLPATAAEQDSSISMVDKFRNPDNQAQGMFRFWLPDASVDQSVLEAHFKAIQEAGFSGVEIAHVPYSRVEGDLATNGWGTPAWQQALIKVYKAANAVPGEFNVDLTVCTQWPAALDTIDPNDDAASQELQMTYQKITTTGINDLSLPQTKLATESGESFIFADHFVAATIAKVSEVTEKGLVLDNSTMQDVSNLTTQAEKQKPAGIPNPDDEYCQQLYHNAGVILDVSGWGDKQKLQDQQYYYQTDLSSVSELNGYTPSTGDTIQAGDWVVFGFYRRGTGDTVSPSGPFGEMGVIGKSFATCGTVLDSYSQTGVSTLIDFWNNNILNEELISLMQQRGGNIFEDSLEANNATMFWNKDMLNSFQEVLGYDVTKYLPYLFSELNGITSSEGNEQDFIQDRSLVEDYLYNNVHLKSLQDWAKTFGYGLKTQSYAHYGSLDHGLAAATVDVAEGETIEFGKSFDRFRTVATGVHTEGKNLISDETLGNGAPYTLTWKQDVATLNAEFAAGVNRIIIHGYSYPNTENMNVPGKDTADVWPGWTTFVSTGDCWGTRQISWQNIDIFSDYIARTEAILQSGISKADLAILTPAFDEEHQSLSGANDGRENDLSSYTALLDQGYTYEVYTEGVLNMEECSVTNGVLNADGSEAKAFIVDNLDTLQLETVQKLYQMAQQGLPVIFAGSLPEKVKGSDTNQTGSINGSSSELQETVSKMQQLDNVYFVQDMDSLFGILKEQQLSPNASYSQKDVRVNLHQDTDGSNYYYLYNDNGKPVTFDVTFNGTGVPYQLDAWTGEIEPIACYQKQNDKVSMTVTLDAGEADFIAISNDQQEFGETNSVWATDADTTVNYTENGMEIRATQPGKYHTAFSDDTYKTITVDEIPEQMNLTDWNLSIESWGPDVEANQTDLTASKKTTVDFGSVGLGLWKDIPATAEQLAELEVDEMGNVSGIGTYTTTINLPDNWDNHSSGYYLNFSHNNDMITNIYVNGNQIHHINQSSDQVDIGKYLQPGENSIQIELTTTMSNRILYEADPDSLFSKLSFINKTCDFGLTDVTLTPYVMETVYENSQEEPIPSHPGESSQPESSTDSISSTDGQNSPQTGDVFPIVGATALLVAGAGIVFLKRKK